MTETITPQSRCVGCRRKTDTHACHHCRQACAMKRQYPNYQQARDVLAERRPDPWDDPTLQVYRCKVREGHYHLGHATGQDAKRLRKRAEKVRRKDLIRSTPSEGPA